MKIYLDYIFIQNLVIDFILLKETEGLSKRKTSNKRMLLSSVISSIYVAIMMYFRLNTLNYTICKILLMTIMIYVSFKDITTKQFFKLIVTFCLVSILNVGCIMVFKEFFNIKSKREIVNLGIYIINFGIVKLFIKYMWKIYKSKIKEKDLVYDVSFKIGGNKYCYKGFLDTGNSVYSYSEGLPIIFAEIKNKKMAKELNNLKSFDVSTVTLSHISKKKGYVIDSLEIRKDEKIWRIKAGIVFEDTKLSKQGLYDMILNYVLYTDEMGGIVI